LTRLRPVASAIRHPLGTLSPPFKATCPPPIGGGGGGGPGANGCFEVSANRTTVLWAEGGVRGQGTWNAELVEAIGPGGPPVARGFLIVPNLGATASHPPRVT